MADADGGGGGVATLPPNAQGLPPPTPEDKAGIRCIICAVDWPLIPALFGYGRKEDDYLISEAQVQEFLGKVANNGKGLSCPVCEDNELFAANNINPIPEDEAWSKKNHADFERYYERTRGEYA